MSLSANTRVCGARTPKLFISQKKVNTLIVENFLYFNLLHNYFPRKVSGRGNIDEKLFWSAIFQYGGKIEIRKEHVEIYNCTNFQNSRKTSQVKLPNDSTVMLEAEKECNTSININLIKF